MILLTQNLSPLLAATIIAIVVWFFRARANDRAEARASQLAEAAKLIQLHAGLLEQFLAHPAPDVELKRLLVLFSDAVADRGIVEKLAEWSASRTFAQPLEETDETIRINKSLALLREHHSELADDFGMIIFSAASGACLRWPESAALFDRAFSRLVATPRRDIVIAVTAKGFRRDMPFSLRPEAAAA
jgi:hypothetical protein